VTVMASKTASWILFQCRLVIIFLGIDAVLIQCKHINLPSIPLDWINYKIISVPGYMLNWISDSSSN